MIRLAGSVLGMVLMLGLGGTLVADARPLLGASLCLLAFATFAGAMTNPRVTAMTATVAVGVGLIAGGRVTEGAGIILLIGMVLLDTRIGRPEAG